MRITNNNLPSGILAGVKPISFARGGVVYRQAGTSEADLSDPSNIIGWIPDKFIEQIKSGLIPVEVPVEIQPGVVRAQTEWREPTTAEESEYHNRLMENLAEQEAAEKAGRGIAKVGGALYDVAGEALETAIDVPIAAIGQLERLPDIEVPDISGGVTSLIERGGDWLENDFVPSVKEGAASVLQSLKNRGYVPESMTEGDLESFLMQAGIRMEELKDQGIGVIRNIGASIEEAGGLMPLLQQQFDYSGRMAALGGEEPGQIPQPPVGAATEEEIVAGTAIPPVVSDVEIGGNLPEGAYLPGKLTPAPYKEVIEEEIPDDPERFAGRVGTWFGNLNTRLKEDPEFRRAFIAGAARMGEGAEGPVPVSLTGQFMRGFGEEQTRQAAAKPDLIKTVEELKKMYGIDPATSLEMLSRSAYSTDPSLMLELREMATTNDPTTISLVKTQILRDDYILLEEGGKEKLGVNTLNSILNDPDLGIKSRAALIAHLLANGYIKDVSGVTEVADTTAGEGSDEERFSKIKAFFKKPPTASGIG